MAKYVINGDSHLKRVNHSQIQGNAKIIARGGWQAHRITEQYLSEFKEYDVCFLIVGGNDVSFHPTYNPLHKTARQTADRLISCQFLLKFVSEPNVFQKTCTYVNSIYNELFYAISFFWSKAKPFEIIVI